MKDSTTETIDLLRGFDSRRLRHEMTDGLADWHRRRSRMRQTRLATGVLAAISLSSGTIMAQQLPDRKMNVSQPFLQQYMYDRTAEMASLL